MRKLSHSEIELARVSCAVSGNENKEDLRKVRRGEKEGSRRNRKANAEAGS